jgi:hypothetical protein
MTIFSTGWFEAEQGIHVFPPTEGFAAQITISGFLPPSPCKRPT